jgi:hypothetical protein
VSRRAIVRNAALASIVEPSTPIRSPFTRPRSATSFSTQPNTVSCASCGRRDRVRDNHE